MISLPLFANISKRIFSATLVVFVEHDEIGKINHVDFFKLACRAIFTGHHVNREIHKIDDFAVALADTGRLDNHQVVA